MTDEDLNHEIEPLRKRVRVNGDDPSNEDDKLAEEASEQEEQEEQEEQDDDDEKQEEEEEENDSLQTYYDFEQTISFLKKFHDFSSIEQQEILQKILDSYEYDRTHAGGEEEDGMSEPDHDKEDESKEEGEGKEKEEDKEENKTNDVDDADVDASKRIDAIRDLIFPILHKICTEWPSSPTHTETDPNEVSVEVEEEKERSTGDNIEPPEEVEEEQEKAGVREYAEAKEKEHDDGEEEDDEEEPTMAEKEQRTVNEETWQTIRLLLTLLFDGQLDGNPKAKSLMSTLSQWQGPSCLQPTITGLQVLLLVLEKACVKHSGLMNDDQKRIQKETLMKFLFTKLLVNMREDPICWSMIRHVSVMCQRFVQVAMLMLEYGYKYLSPTTLIYWLKEVEACIVLDQEREEEEEREEEQTNEQETNAEEVGHGDEDRDREATPGLVLFQYFVNLHFPTFLIKALDPYECMTEDWGRSTREGYVSGILHAIAFYCSRRFRSMAIPAFLACESFIPDIARWVTLCNHSEKVCRIIIAVSKYLLNIVSTCPTDKLQTVVSNTNTNNTSSTSINLARTDSLSVAIAESSYKVETTHDDSNDHIAKIASQAKALVRPIFSFLETTWYSVVSQKPFTKMYCDLVQLVLRCFDIFLSIDSSYVQELIWYVNEEDWKEGYVKCEKWSLYHVMDLMKIHHLMITTNLPDQEPGGTTTNVFSLTGFKCLNTYQQCNYIKKLTFSLARMLSRYQTMWSVSYLSQHELFTMISEYRKKEPSRYDYFLIEPAEPDVKLSEEEKRQGVKDIFLLNLKTIHRMIESYNKCQSTNVELQKALSSVGTLLLVWLRALAMKNCRDTSTGTSTAAATLIEADPTLDKLVLKYVQKYFSTLELHDEAVLKWCSMSFWEMLIDVIVMIVKFEKKKQETGIRQTANDQKEDVGKGDEEEADEDDEETDEEEKGLDIDENFLVVDIMSRVLRLIIDKSQNKGLFATRQTCKCIMEMIECYKNEQMIVIEGMKIIAALILTSAGEKVLPSLNVLDRMVTHVFPLHRENSEFMEVLVQLLWYFPAHVRTGSLLVILFPSLMQSMIQEQEKEEMMDHLCACLWVHLALKPIELGSCVLEQEECIDSCLQLLQRYGNTSESIAQSVCGILSTVLVDSMESMLHGHIFYVLISNKKEIFNKFRRPEIVKVFASLLTTHSLLLPLVLSIVKLWRVSLLLDPEANTVEMVRGLKSLNAENTLSQLQLTHSEDASLTANVTVLKAFLQMMIL